MNFKILRFFILLPLFIYACTEAKNPVLDELQNWSDTSDHKGMDLALSHIAHPEKAVQNAAIELLKKYHPDKWIKAVEKAQSFTVETNLLNALIHSNTLHNYQRFTANRLQTFDLKFLSVEEQAIIIDLYRSYFQDATNMPLNILQTAHTKLQFHFPTENEQINQKISKILTKLAEQIEK